MTKEKYITVQQKNLCSGCTACVAVCPKQCISMYEDTEGFLYPQVDFNKCVKCGKCINTCPYKNSKYTDKPIESELALCYAAYNNDEDTRYNSASGGMFRLFADEIINRQGVVFGVILDENFTAKHSYTENTEGLVPMMGSKYMQSRLEDSFAKAKRFLDEGRNVLFTGTGCQIGGLKAYLGKHYENLYTMDVICHGVDSPKTWLEYLHYIASEGTIERINFRDKTTGQDNSSLSITTSKSTHSEREKKSPLFASWKYSLFLRPSCELCPFKQENKISDITIGDCWGFQVIAPEMYDDRGLSSLIIHTKQGQSLMESVKRKMTYKLSDLNDVKKFNSDYIKSYPFDHQKRTAFWKEYNKKEKDFFFLLTKYTKPSIRESFKSKIRVCYKHLRSLLSI